MFISKIDKIKIFKIQLTRLDLVFWWRMVVFRERHIINNKESKPKIEIGTIRH